MEDEQIIEALDKSELHWVNNEVTFAKLTIASPISGIAAVREQTEWFLKECMADKCALCDLFEESCRNDIIFCPLNDYFLGCCAEWDDLRHACKTGNATTKLVHAVTERIHSERAKFNQEIAKDKQP